jgi:hypothetical protein
VDVGQEWRIHVFVELEQHSILVDQHREVVDKQRGVVVEVESSKQVGCQDEDGKLGVDVEKHKDPFGLWCAKKVSVRR